MVPWTSLAASQSLQVFGITRSLHRDLGDGVVDVAELVRQKLDARRGDVLFQAVQLRGAGNRNDPRLLQKQPGERDLRRRRLFRGGDHAQPIHQNLVRLAGFRRKPRHDVAEVLAVERRILTDRAGEETLAKWTEWDKAN